MTYISIYPNLCLWLTSTLRSSFEPIYFAVSLPQRRLLHAIALHVLGNTSEVQKPAAQPTCTSQHPQEGHSAPLSARTRGMQMTNIKIWLADFGGVIFMYLYHPHDIFLTTCNMHVANHFLLRFPIWTSFFKKDNVRTGPGQRLLANKTHTKILPEKKYVLPRPRQHKVCIPCMSSHEISQIGFAYNISYKKYIYIYIGALKKPKQSHQAP